MLNRAYAPTPKEKKIVDALKQWGCPVHWNIIEQLTGYGFLDLSPVFTKLVNAKAIRRVRPGVYSYYSEERD